ncbi:MAG: dihydrofolate reductase family protein [Acidimicrobiia bacterium]
MADLVYHVIASLDGYVADATGDFAWSEPDAEVHAFVNRQERAIGTALYGRRMYEVMVAWETMDPKTAGNAEIMREYQEIWQTTDKVVYSGTLAEVTSARTRLERTFDPGAVRGLKDAATQSVSIGGPGLAAAALHAGLVDECGVYVNPVVVGGGTPWLPEGLRLDLDLVDEHRFGNGVVFLRYRVRHRRPPTLDR